MSQSVLNQTWHPVYNAHAIEQVVIYAGFDSVVEQTVLPEAHKKITEKYSTELPRQQTISMPILAMGLGNIPPIAMSPSIAGYTFQKFHDDGTILNELSIDGANIAFKTFRYTQWFEVWGNAQRYFYDLLPLYAKSAQLNSIGLQYTDKFIQKDASIEGGLSTLLRQSSPYLSPHIYTAQDLWHSYTGAFTKANDQTKRLINVNSDLLEEPNLHSTQKVTRINISLTDIFNQVGFDKSTILEENINSLCSSHLEELHNLNKEMLGNIITDEMSKRIGLKSK